MLLHGFVPSFVIHMHTHTCTCKQTHHVYIHSGFTTLHLAIVKSRNEVAKMLISELGAKGMGAVNESGITATHVAASSGMGM